MDMNHQQSHEPMNMVLLLKKHGAQVANQMNLISEKPSAEERRRYETARRERALYKAASMLWSKGITMPEAISIVDKAMTEAGD